MRPTPASEFRIAAEYRRCCWYVLISEILLAPFFYWVARFAENRGAGQIAVGFALFILVAVAMVAGLQWRLRVDHAGVSRRLLGRWDLWPWAALASGRVRKLHRFTLYDPERPWWGRKLSLEMLAHEDAQEVFKRINEHYRLPPPPELPEVLSITYCRRQSAKFDRNGIQLIVGDVPIQYHWRDLREVHITRMEPLRRDFRKLVLALPDREIELKLVVHQYGTSPTWRGAAAEELSEFFRQFVPPDRINVSIAGQKLTKREHIERELKALRKSARELKIIAVVGGASMSALLLWMAMNESVIKAICMGAMFLICPGSVMIAFHHVIRMRISQQLEALNNVSAVNKPK